jgi:hypothetical protein
MTTVRIPRSANAAVAALTDLGALVTATEWQRAAIVATLVGPAPGSGGPPDRGGQSPRTGFAYTPTTLAALGITGLRKTDTIARYRDAWFDAGRTAPTLGQTVDLDGLPDWPPTTDYTRNVRDPERVTALTEQAEADGTGPNMTVKIAGSPKALAAAIKADPATAEAAAAALAATPQGRLTAYTAIDKATPPVETPRPRREETQSDLMIAVMKVNKADNDLITAVRAHQDRLLGPEVDILTNAVKRMRAAADFVEALATGQTLDEELISLLEEGS